MKTQGFKLMLLMMIISISGVFAQEVKTEKIDVNGKCGMCKTRIEKAALSIDGVKTADWNIETHVLEVTYNKSKTSSDEIQKKIADVGHDTEKYKADDKVYNTLPACCRYR